VELSCSLHVNNAWAAGAGAITHPRSGGIRGSNGPNYPGKAPKWDVGSMAGSQNSGHLDPTGGKLGGGARKQLA
jgi:hypothetical protein